MLGVYPRGRGGTGRRVSDLVREAGLSPRARGNRQGNCLPQKTSGSIPAGAGEPRSSSSSDHSMGVYPRGRGGTLSQGVPDEGSEGLSPRARGNHERDPREQPLRGSIPAGAGEPTLQRWECVSMRVYPRGRGGTKPFSTMLSGAGGLSPRARGNQLRGLRVAPERGSIPAGAGEPAWTAA